MATQKLIPAPTCADTAGTAPLPPKAAEALASLERRLTGQSVADTLAHEAGSYVRVTPDVQRAVTRYEVAAARYAELSVVDGRAMTGAEFQALADAKTVMDDAVRFLTGAGQLHLVDAMYAKAARFRALSTVIDRLTARESHYMTPADWRELHAAQDERADLYFELKRASRLDLIGGV